MMWSVRSQKNNPVKYANCNEKHTAFSRDCPEWQKENRLVGDGSEWEKIPTQTILVSNYAATSQESLLQNPHNSALEKILL